MAPSAPSSSPTMAASIETPSADLQAELQHLREQNRRLQSQVDALTSQQDHSAATAEGSAARRPSSTSLDSARDVKEPVEMVRSTSLDGDSVVSSSHSGLHHRHVFRKGSNGDSVEHIDVSCSYDSCPPSNKQHALKAKASDLDYNSTPVASNITCPSRRKLDPPPGNDAKGDAGFENEYNNTHLPTSRKGTKRSSDGGGRYFQTMSLEGDEEDGRFPDVHIQNGHEDDGSESDGLMDDDSSHNKHIPQTPGSPCSLIASPAHSFPPLKEQIKERAGWLIGLLFLQSCSSFIIQYNQNFLQSHMVIVQFLTMLVGAGGNAGNQASVRVIRSLAVGTLNRHTMKPFLAQEAKMALSLSGLIGLTGFIRASLFRTPWGETIAITTSVCAIVAISVAIGSTLPLAMKKVGIDPAHSSTTIQVVMDILGVLITVCVSSFVLSFSVFQNDDSGSSVGGTDDGGL